MSRIGQIVATILVEELLGIALIHHQSILTCDSQKGLACRRDVHGGAAPDIRIQPVGLARPLAVAVIIAQLQGAAEFEIMMKLRQSLTSRLLRLHRAATSKPEGLGRSPQPKALLPSSAMHFQQAWQGTVASIIRWICFERMTVDAWMNLATGSGVIVNNI